MKGGGEHRRGRSMGSTTPLSDNKDEELALFHEMKRREKHNFLHPSPDDLDVSLSSKFGGMGAPAKKSGTDLLTSDVDKNDYDWLLTPPGTPLFPSLDQEAAALAALSPQASILGSSSANTSKISHSPADPSPKTTRGNPSPRRSGSTTPNGTMSRSRSTPHNSISVVATVTRPSTPTSSLARPSTPTAKSSSTPSVRASTPNLKLSISASKSSSSTASTPTVTRPSTPNARSSTPPVRPSTPGARSSTPTSKPSTPTMRRSLSGGRIASSPATTRGGPSPKRTTSSRGNSPAAKRVTPVITTVPGMCSEAPPNLRTTVPERNSSTPKSSSNGSRSVSEFGHASDAMDASGRSRRRPRSPSVSRSFSSSSSQDQRTSSQTSRGSVISSYDDGIEVSRPTLQSSRNSSAGKWHAAGHEDLLSGKANTNVQAKRVTKSLVISSNSSLSGGTPTKKSLEPNKWQGEAYQHSPSSYRHLVSSSPGSPFYGSRANSLLVRPASAMNSSVTTSSNASSEHGTTVAPDTEGSERDDDDLLSWDSYGRRMSPSPRGRQADVLMLDKDDEKLSPWQDYERLNSNDLVASYKTGVQSTLDTEVTSFYESDGMASFEMLEQLGLMGEVYNSKKGTPGERVLQRRASNIEDGKAELRRPGERTLQRRASNIEDSRIPDIRRSDDGSRLTRATSNKQGHDGESNPGHQGLKSKRQELLESLNDTWKYDDDILKNTGERARTSQKNKVSSAEIHAACLFVRDFRVGLAPSHGQETAPAVANSLSAPEEEAGSTNWLGDGVSCIMSRNDFGNVRQTHDFSQQKLKVSAGSAFPQMESKLPRLPQSTGKVGNSELVYSHLHEGSSKADVLRLKSGEDYSANNSALSVLVDVMERIKNESSQPKYLDLENQVPKTISPTGAVVDDRLRGLTNPQSSEIKRGLSYEEIHAMDEVDTPELHDIEDDSLMYDGGNDELELLESLHRSALRKGEVRVMEEVEFHESPKRRYFTPEEAEISSLEVDQSQESPKRRCVEVAGEKDLSTRDGIVLHGSLGFSHEEADVAVTSMNLDDFLRPSMHNEMEVKGCDAKESQVLVGSLHLTEQNDGVLSIDKVDVFPTSEKTQLSVADSEVRMSEFMSSTGVCALDQEYRTALKSVFLLPAGRVLDQAVSNSSTDVERVEQMDEVGFDEQCGESTTVTPDVSHCSEEGANHLHAASDLQNEGNFSHDADKDSVYLEVDDSSPLLVDVAEGESINREIPDGKEEDNLPLDSSTSSSLDDDEGFSSFHPGSLMEQPVPLNSQFAVGSAQEEETIEPHDTEDADEAKIVKNVEVFHSEGMLSKVASGATTGEGHQEGIVSGIVCDSDAASSEISVETFVMASEEYQGQVKEPVRDMVADSPYLEDPLIPSADEVGDSEEHEAVSDESHEIQKRIEEPSPDDGNLFVEDLVRYDAASSDIVDTGKFLGEPASKFAPLSMLDRSVSPDVPSSNLNLGLEHYHLDDSTSMGDTETASSREVDFSGETVRNDRSVSQVSRSVLLSSSVTGSDVFLSSICEPSPKHHVIEESQSLEYVDTKSLDTSDYFEATSEEKVDSQEVSSGVLAERKEGAFIHPNVLSCDGRTGISEVVSKPKGRLSSSLSEMRSASSLCAALEEQLAGLIQKIDSAIEESSKSFISGHQEGMVGRDKLSARTSELLREQEPDESLEAVRSSQEEDLLDMLWAEDDDSGNSEGSGEDEFSQFHDSKPSGKDGNPAQVNGEIRLSRSSENGSTLYSNGRPSEISPDMEKLSSPIFMEEDISHMESPKRVIERDENVTGADPNSPGSVPAGAFVDTTATVIFDEHDKRDVEHKVSLNHQDCAESPTLSTEVPMDDDGVRDMDSCRELYADMAHSDEDERDASVGEIGSTDDISFLLGPLDDLSEPVSGDGSLSAKDSPPPHQLMTVDVEPKGEEGQRREEGTCTDDVHVGEFVSVGVWSTSVTEVEEFVSHNSACYEDASTQDSQVGQIAVAGQEEVNDLELAENDVRSAEVGFSKNLLFANEPVEHHVSEARGSAEEDTGSEDSLTGQRIRASKFGPSAEQDLIPCDGFAVEGPKSSVGGVDLEEQESLGESPAISSVGESDEHHLMVEGPETTKLLPTEQNLLGDEQECSHALRLLDKYALEASNVVITEKLYSCEEKDTAEFNSQVSELEPPDQFSALDNDLAGEGCKERNHDEVVAVVGKDSAECVSSFSGSHSPVLNAIGSPEFLVPQTSRTRNDHDENLTSGPQLICSEDGCLRLAVCGLREEHAEEQRGSEVSSQPTPQDTPVDFLVLSESSKEQSEPQTAQTFRNESEELSDVCEVPTTTDEDRSNEEMIVQLEVSEGQIGNESRLSEHSNSTSYEQVQHSSDVDKATVTDEEDSFLECISHDSNSISISRGSITSSSEQETYSAGTQGAGEEEQEETSQMQFSSCSNRMGQGLESFSHQETLPDKGCDDHVTVAEKMVVVDTLDPPSSDTPVDQFELAPSADTSISVQADGVVEVLSNMLTEGPERVDHEERHHSPIQSEHSAASGNALTCSVSEVDTGESHSLREDVTDIGHADSPLISLGESPACSGSTEVWKSYEAGSADSPKTGESLKTVETQSADLFADKGEHHLSPSVSDARIHSSDKEDFITIGDDAWDEQRGEHKCFPSSGSLKQIGTSDTGNVTEQSECQMNLPHSGRAWNMNESLGQSEVPQTSGGDLVEKPKDYQEDLPLHSPSTGMELVMISSMTEFTGSDVTPTGRATAEAVEPKMKNEGDTLSETGVAEASVIGDHMNGVGNQSARKLPISEAKSVRTISLTLSSPNELASDGRLSPDGAAQVPKSTAYTSVTIVSPESLKWEPNATGVCVSGLRDDSASAGNEVVTWNAQGVNSSPASVRRALAFMGQQASSFTPTETCLQSPPSQVFERDSKSPEQGGEKAATDERNVPDIKSPPKVTSSPSKEVKNMDAPAHTVIEVSSKRVAPVKAPKAKCSCTIM